jgi:hypothetical protein
MSFVFERAARKLPLASERCDPQAGERIRCADKSTGAGFPGEMTKVAVISVDTAGREVTLPGQEGICVQWR